MNEAPASFKSVYRRHTPFSMVQYMTIIQGDTIRIEPKGDLLSYVYLTRTDKTTGLLTTWDWTAFKDFSWYIGGQLIDKQDINYIRYVFPNLVAKSYSKQKVDTLNTLFLPLAFSFCHEIPLPIVSLNYDRVEIRLTFGDSYNTSKFSYQCFTNYIFLAEPERNWFALNKFQIPITQVQEVYDPQNVTLSGPVKFIATPPTKISDDFQYSILINGKESRSKGPYTGSELMFHSDYTMDYTKSSDVYPPGQVTNGRAFIDSAYGRGFYSTTSSSYADGHPSWNVTYQDGSYWQSGISIARRTVFTLTASSNSVYTWGAFSGKSNVWVSDKGYGQLLRYEIHSSSNVANAWMALDSTWESYPETYGSNISTAFTHLASSNIGNAWMAFSVGQLWISNSVYYSDFTGTYISSASSDSTNAYTCFDMTSNYWSSNALYGYYINAGSFTTVSSSNTTNAYLPFSTGGSWISDPAFGRFSKVDRVLVDNSSGNVLNIFTGAGNWISNSMMNTYGFSSWYGMYNSYTTSNTINSWLSTTSTPWTSDPAFGNTFTGSFSINVFSNTTNDWYVCDSNPTTFWTGQKLFTEFTGNATSITSTFSNTGNAWKSFTSDGWVSDIAFGNTCTGIRSINVSSSSNVTNAWTAFNDTRIFVSNATYYQNSIVTGTYTTTNSSGVANTLTFGLWRSANTYGRFSTNVLSINNSSLSTSSALYNYTGNFVGTTTNVSFSGYYPNSSGPIFPVDANCTNEFLVTLPAGKYTSSASNVNNLNAYNAFTSTGFNWQVSTFFSSFASLTVNSIQGSGNFPSTYGTSYVWTTGQKFSNTLMGLYTSTANSNNTNAWRAFAASVYTATDVPIISGYNQNSSVSVTFPSIIPIEAISLTSTWSSSGSGDNTSSPIGSLTVEGTIDAPEAASRTWVSWVANQPYRSIKFSQRVVTPTKSYNYNDSTVGISTSNVRPTNIGLYSYSTESYYGGFRNAIVSATSNPTNAYKIVSGQTWTNIPSISAETLTMYDGSTLTGEFIRFRSDGVNYNDTNVTNYNLNPTQNKIILYCDDRNYYNITDNQKPSGRTADTIIYYYQRDTSVSTTQTASFTYTTPLPPQESFIDHIVRFDSGSCSGCKFVTPTMRNLGYRSTTNDSQTSLVFNLQYVKYVGNYYNNNGLDDSIYFDPLYGPDYSFNYGFQNSIKFAACPIIELYNTIYYVASVGLGRGDGSTNQSTWPYILEDVNTNSKYIVADNYFSSSPILTSISYGGTKFFNGISSTITDTDLSRPYSLDAIYTSDSRWGVTSYNFIERFSIIYTFNQPTTIYAIRYTCPVTNNNPPTMKIFIDGSTTPNTQQALINDGNENYLSLSSLTGTIFIFQFFYGNGQNGLNNTNGNTKYFHISPSVLRTSSAHNFYLYNTISNLPQEFILSSAKNNDYFNNINLLYRNNRLNKFLSVIPPKINCTLPVITGKPNFTKFRVSTNLPTHNILLDIPGYYYNSEIQVPSGWITFPTTTLPQTTQLSASVYGSTIRSTFDYKIEFTDDNGNGITSPAFINQFTVRSITVNLPTTSNLVQYSTFNYFPKNLTQQNTTFSASNRALGGYNLSPLFDTPYVTVDFGSGKTPSSYDIATYTVSTTPGSVHYIQYKNDAAVTITTGPDTGNGINTSILNYRYVVFYFKSINSQTYDNKLLIDSIQFFDSSGNAKNDTNGWRFYDYQWTVGNIQMKKGGQNILTGVFTNGNSPTITDATNGITKAGGTAIKTYSGGPVTAQVGEYILFNFQSSGGTFTAVNITPTPLAYKVFYKSGTSFSEWTGGNFTTSDIAIYVTSSSRSDGTYSTTDIQFSIDGQNDIRQSAGTSGGDYIGPERTIISTGAKASSIPGEWVEMVFPSQVRVTGISFNSSTINKFSLFGKNSGAYSQTLIDKATVPASGTYSNLVITPQTSDTFRLLVSNTLSGTGTNSAGIDSIVLYISNGTTSPVPTSNNYYILTSGLDVGLFTDYSKLPVFNSVANLIVKNYTFDSGRYMLDGYDPPLMITGTIYPSFSAASANSSAIYIPFLSSLWIKKNSSPTITDVTPVYTPSQASYKQELYEYSGSNINFSFSTTDVLYFKAITNTNSASIYGSVLDGMYMRMNANPWYEFSTSNYPSSFGTKVVGKYFPGGPYNGYASNLYTEITLKSPVRLGGYIIDPGTANVFVLYGMAGSTKTRLDTRNNLWSLTDYTISPTTSYDKYRLEIVSTKGSNLYGTIEKFILKDSNQNIIYNTSSNVIPNYKYGMFNVVPSAAYSPINGTGTFTGTISQSITVTFPMANIYHIYTKGTFTSFGPISSTTCYPGFTTLTTPLHRQTSLTLNFTNFTSLSNLILYDNYGRIIPDNITASSNIGTPYGSKYVGGLTQTRSPTTINGEWVALTLPSANVYKYIVKQPPVSWDLVGYTSDSWRTIESIRNYYGSTYSNVLVNKITDLAYSNIAFIVFESLESSANILSVNLYARNFTNIYSNGIFTITSSSNLYNTTSASSNVSSKDSFELRTIFINPTRVEKITFTNDIIQGIQTDESQKSYFSTSLGSTNGIRCVQYGNLFCYQTGTYDFSFGQGATAFDTLNIDGTTYAGGGGQITRNAGQWINLGTDSTVPITVTLPNGKTDLTNSLFPLQNQNYTYFTVPKSYILFGNVNGTYTQLQYGLIAPSAKTVITVSDKRFFSEINVYFTKSSSLVTMNNYTIFSEFGPVNIPTALGGTGSEWIKIKLNSSTSISGYSFESPGVSSWILEGSINDSAYTAVHSLSSYYSPEKFFIIPASTAYQYYRLTVTETSTPSLQIGKFKLYDSNRLYINPYQTSNDFNDTITYRPMGLMGKYEFASSTTADYSTIFDGQATDTGMYSYDLYGGGYTGSVSTKVSNNLIYGNWEQIKLPVGVVANTFVMTAPTNPLYSPNIFTFCGSYDGYNWLNCNTFTFNTVPNAFSQYSFTSLQGSNNYNYYRFIVSNCITSTTPQTPCSIGTIKILDSNGFMIESFSNTQNQRITNPNVGGGRGFDYLNLNISSNSMLSYVTLDVPSYGLYPSNINVWDMVTKSLIEYITPSTITSSNVRYNFNTSRLVSNVRFTYQSINYNPYSDGRALVRNLKVYDIFGMKVSSPFTSNTYQDPIAPRQNFFTDVPYTCSNVLPFDDDPTTSWYSDRFRNTDGVCLDGTTYPFVTFTFPRPVTVSGVRLTNATLNQWSLQNQQFTSPTSTSQYYTLNPSLSGTTFKFTVITTLVGMNVASIAGLTFYGNVMPYGAKTRLNPTMTSTTTLVQNQNITGGVTSNESVIVRFYTNVLANSYSITTNSPLSSWDVYSGTSTTALHTVTNFYNDESQTLDFTFPTSNVSNLRVEVYSLQPTFSNSSYLSVNNIQLYSNEGVPLIPTMTSNNTYKAGLYSPEIPGNYIVSASYFTDDVSKAFDGNDATSYSSGGYLPASDRTMGPAGLTLLTGNTVISNCTDFRNITQATKGAYMSGTPCKWIGQIPLGVIVTPYGSFSYNAGVLTFDYPFSDGAVFFGDAPFSNLSVNADWIKIQFPTLVAVNGVFVKGYSMDATSLQGSNDDTQWTTISSVTINVMTTFTKVKYKYLRLVSTNFTQIVDISFYNDSGRINSYLV